MDDTMNDTTGDTGTMGMDVPLRTVREGGYDPDTVNLLARLMRISITHPHHPCALTAAQARRWRIPRAEGAGVSRADVDEWVDIMADRLEHDRGEDA